MFGVRGGRIIMAVVTALCASRVQLAKLIVTGRVIASR
jgi:hypothetical protein